MLKMTVLQSSGDLLRRHAEHRDPAAVGHVGDHRVQRIRAARHLEADVEALDHAELALDVGQVALARVDRQRGAHPPGQVEPVRVEVGDDDVARAGVADDRRRHAADRAGAGDQHVLAEHRELRARCGRRCRTGRRSRRRRRRCRRRGARCSSSAARSARRTRPGRLTPTPLVCAHRWRRPAMQLRQRPQTTWPSPETMSPAWKSFTFDPTATISPTNSWPIIIGTGIVRWRPRVPVSDVQVGAADARAADADQDVVQAVLGLGDVLEPQARLGVPLDERQHRVAS